MHGLKHSEVFPSLKNLPIEVQLVCARSKREELLSNQSTNFVNEIVETNYGRQQEREEQQGYDENSQPYLDRLVKAKSDGSLALSPIASSPSTHTTELSKLRSRSLEPLSGLAMWSNEPQIIELIKGDRGLGFSILDYQVGTTEFCEWQ